MKQIQSNFSFTNARNAEHMQLHTNMLEAITGEFATAQGVGAQRDAYAAAVAAEQDCFLGNQAFEDTPQLQAADRRRDNGFYLVANVADAYAKYALDDDERAAGERLAYVIRPARDAAQKSYAEETAILSDLYGKLLDPASATDLATLRLAEAVETAREANDAFNTLYVTRSAELRTRASSATMKQLRPLTDEAFSALAEAINAFYMVNALSTKDEAKEEALGGAIDAANGLLVQLDRVIRARGGKGSATMEPDDTDKPGDTTDPGTTPGGEEPTDPEQGGEGGETESPDTV